MLGASSSTLSSSALKVSSVSQDDPELQDYMEQVTAQQSDSFRTRAIWKPSIDVFEERQTAKPFTTNTWTRWLKDNKEATNWNKIHASDANRRMQRASVVKPLPDAAIGRRSPMPPLTIRPILVPLPLETVVRGHPANAGGGSSPPLMPSSEAGPDAAGHIRPIAITPKTYQNLSRLPAPEHYVDGISLVAHILDSHYRLRNIQDDETRRLHSVEYFRGQRREALQRDATTFRAESSAYIVRVAQRSQTERRPPEWEDLMELYYGFAVCSAIAGASDENTVAATSETDALDNVYLTLADDDTCVHPPSYRTFLTSPIVAPTSELSALVRTAPRSPIRLTIAALRAASIARSAPLMTKSTWDGHHHDATFLEFLMRQYPFARQGTEERVVQAMMLGALPVPSWITSLFVQYARAPSRGHLSNGDGSTPTNKKVVRMLTPPKAVAAMRRKSRTPSPQEQRRRVSQQVVALSDTDRSLSSTLCATPGVTMEAVVRLLSDKASKPTSEGDDNNNNTSISATQAHSIISVAQHLMDTYDVDKDGMLSEREFVAAVWNNPSLKCLGRW